MIFASPWVLLALVALPVLWWLLRVTPPAPRTEYFPALRLLSGLTAPSETPAHTPWWLLALRVLAAALVVVGLARPVLDAGAALPGRGPVLLVIDDGWAAAADWPRRMAAANSALDRAEREGRAVVLLGTAPSESGALTSVSPTMPAADARTRLAALRPKAWPTDRAAAATALAGWAGKAGVVYIADGLTDGAGWNEFADALHAVGPVATIAAAVPPARLLLPPRAEADRLVAHVAQTPHPAPVEQAILAQSGDDRTLARAVVTIAPGETGGDANIQLPPELRNRLARLVLEGPTSAGSVVLLDEHWRRRPVGMLAGDATTAETPLTGPLFYLRRALEPYAELREGDLTTLLSRQLSVLILADHVIGDEVERGTLEKWVQQGGLLVRFAGPAMAEHPDTLLPEHLLDGDRQLGGTLSWSKPASLAPFAAGSPFAGLTVPPDIKVNRQVLAEPNARLSEATWASLADGTPLVTQMPMGAGRIVLFHVTANADWSDLPLSGLFVDMLRRLVALSVGVAGADEADVKLAPVETLDGFGLLSPPPPAASAVLASAIDETPASPLHPPGLYGPESRRHALNLADRIDLPTAAPAITGARDESLGITAPERQLGPWLLAAALALLAIDLLVSLRLRGLLRPAAVALALAVLISPVRAADAPENPALVTRLAYVVTGDEQLDSVSHMGLSGLSDYVNRRTAASLGEPAAVQPGTDDLSFYPLLYWPISGDAAAPPGAAIAALNDYMAHGGIILIDSRNGGSGEGFVPGGQDALTRVAAGLNVPALAPLTTGHVLARAFYLLQDFPGRYDGDTVWVQRDQDRANDSVSPVIIGGHDWAAAWAVDAQGHNPYAVIPGGARQRTLAYRFGVNLVMYALTGNYKGDQVHVPAILERLGQ